MAGMDSEETFQAVCAKIGVPDPVLKVLVSRGLKTPARFYWPLKEGAEETFRAIVEEAQVDVSAAASSLQCAEAGLLRRLLHECRGIRDAPATPVLPTVPVPTPPSKPSSSLFGLDLGPRLPNDKLQQLWSEFAANYPAEVIHGDTKPCKALIQLVFSQKSANEMRFIPWRQILSEAQADRAKGQKKEKTFLDLLADAAGHADAMEQEPNPSHYGVYRLLMVRATAWALAGWCHLGSGRRLVQAFMDLYSAPGLGVLGLRSPTVGEAELADGELCRQLNTLLNEGFSLDSALHELVMVRHSLHLWLQPKPKVLVQDMGLNAKRPKRSLPQPLGEAKKSRGKPDKGKTAEAPSSKNKGLCFAFKKHGTCAFGDACKFEHAKEE